MQRLLDHRLIVVTGKGGVGKTTIAGALGLIAARRGMRTLVLDVTGASMRLRNLFAEQPHMPPDERADAKPPDKRADAKPPDERADAKPPDERTDTTSAGRTDVPFQLTERLWSASIDSDSALLEWMQALGGRIPARLLASRASFQYFAAAAPGGRELVCMVKVCELARHDRYDLVVLDAPATGHALAMLTSPRTFAAIARVGPVASQAQDVLKMLQDDSQTGYLAVAQASEMAVSETLDLQQELADQLGVQLACVIVNATMHRRFTGEELERIASLHGEEQVSASSRLAKAAAAAAQAAHVRTRFQHSQVARLRRHGLAVLQVPFVFQSDLDLDAMRAIADRLEGKL